MHGLINRAIQCFVRDTYGPDTWTKVAHEAELGFVDFEAMLNYDAKLTRDVLFAASVVLDRPEPDILEDIGTYLVTFPKVEALRRLLRFGGVTFEEFLHSLDDLPDRARLAVADLDLPVIELREHSATEFSLMCRSKVRGYGHVLIGVLRAMADDYGALVFMDFKGYSGEEEVISISLLEKEFAEGRVFELGARAG